MSTIFYLLAEMTSPSEAMQALVRQYLTKRGMTSVLSAFDEDSPRSESTITSSKRLCSALGLGKLSAANKKRGTPFASLLEVLAYYYCDKGSLRSRSGKSGKSGGSSRQSKGKVDLLMERTEPSLIIDYRLSIIDLFCSGREFSSLALFM